MIAPRCWIFCLLILLAQPVWAFEKWFYYPTNLLVEKNVDQLETLWKRASAAGYTHVLLSDSKFSRLHEMDARYFKHVERVKKIAAELKLEIVPAIFPVGYSNDLLGQDVNLIEGQPVRDLPLIVQGGVARLDDPAAPTLPPISDLKKWSWKDDNVVADQDGARVRDAGGKNARLVQKIQVQPWRQYHLSVRIKTAEFPEKPEIKVLPTGGKGSLQWDNLGVKKTQDWTVHHAVFNSQSFREVSVFFGVWGANQGSLWWADAQLEEVAFLNLIRRPGAPLRIQTENGRALTEGRDFEPLTDPALGNHPWRGEFDTFHTPPVLKTKGLPDGTKLRASYYHGTTVYDHQAMICLSEPKTYELLRDQARRLHAAWGAKGYMMSHDEIRVANWCAACEARHLTPGELLADNVRRCIGFLREVNPGGRIYVWNDMFDPNHNAVPGPYYLVNGPLTGSWEGLDKDIIIVPWYYEKRTESLKFFADRGHRQVIAGYYDSRPEKVADWLKAAKAVPGSVLGVIYTTWKNDYSNLEKFSAGIDGK